MIESVLSDAVSSDPGMIIIGVSNFFQPEFIAAKQRAAKDVWFKRLVDENCELKRLRLETTDCYSGNRDHLLGREHLILQHDDRQICTQIHYIQCVNGGSPGICFLSEAGFDTEISGEQPFRLHFVIISGSGIEET
jgi:hypothetical protein